MTRSAVKPALEESQDGLDEIRHRLEYHQLKIAHQTRKASIFFGVAVAAQLLSLGSAYIGSLYLNSFWRVVLMVSLAVGIFVAYKRAISSTKIEKDLLEDSRNYYGSGIIDYDVDDFRKMYFRFLARRWVISILFISYLIGVVLILLFRR